MQKLQAVTSAKKPSKKTVDKHKKQVREENRKTEIAEIGKPRFGRTTEYKPEYCDEVIEYARNKKSLVRFCADKLVSHQTATNWKNNYPDFLASCDIAKVIMESHYLERADNRCDGLNQGSDNMIKFLLSSVYNYREKTDVTTTNDTTIKAKIELDFGSRPVLDFGDDESTTSV